MDVLYVFSGLIIATQIIPAGLTIGVYSVIMVRRIKG